MKKFSVIRSNFSMSCVSKDKLPSLIMDFLENSPKKLFDTRVESLFESKIVKSLMNSEVRKVEDFASFKLFNTSREERLAKVTIYILKGHSEKIKFFLEEKSCFEECLAKSDYSEAEKHIKSIENFFGESLWLIRNKLLLLTKKGNIEEKQMLCDSLLARCENASIKQIINFYIYLYGTNDKSRMLRNSVSRLTKEWRNGGINDQAEFFESLFIPNSKRKRLQGIGHVYISQLFPIIDQYEFFVSEWSKFICDKDFEDTLGIIGDVKSLYNLTNDYRIKKCLNYIEGDYLYDLDSHDLDLISKYEAGDYKLVVEDYIKRDKNLTSILGAINIVAKSMAFTDYEAKIDSDIGKAICMFRDIYLLNNETISSIDSLEDFSIEYEGATIGYALQSSLVLSLCFSLDVSELRRILGNLSIMCGFTLPIVQSIINSKEDVFDRGMCLVSQEEVCSKRKERDRLFRLKHEEDDHDLICSIINSSDVLYKDKIETQLHAYLKSNNISNVLSIAAREISKNPVVFKCFPIDALIKEVEDKRISTLDSVIVCFASAKYISKESHMLLNEVFDEFVDCSGCSYPSDMLTGKDTLDSKEVLFFKKICTLDVMDYLPVFSDSFELRTERMKILKYLLENNYISVDEYIEEAGNIVDQIIKDSAANQINTSKIYVNVSAIKEIVSEEVSSLFEMYNSYQSNRSEESDLLLLNNVNSSSDDGETEHAFISGGKISILSKIVDLIYEVYLYHESYGLDANLSTEIRHGFFSNLVRSGLEKERLITEVDDEGCYKKNEYWYGIYENMLYEDVVLKIDEYLRAFSKEFDAIIDDAKIWMNVTINATQPGAVFNYAISIDHLKRLNKHMVYIESHGELVDIILEDLSKQTDQNIKSMQELLNTSFKDKCVSAFESLELDVKDAMGGKNLKELKEAVDRSKVQTQENILIISDWFNRSGKSDFVSRSMGDVINISIDCFVKIKGMEKLPSISLLPREMSGLVSGVHVKSLVLTFINILDNSYNHSGLGRNTSIEIKEVNQDSFSSVLIINDVSSIKREFITSELIEKINGPIDPGTLEALMRTEGGTGLAKTKYHLSTISEKSGIQVSLNEKGFVAEVIYA